MFENDVYEKEIIFYKSIAPKINEMLARLEETSQLIAMPYGVSHANDAILFEDLSAKGYRIASIYRGYDFNETALVLKQVATFHACNAKIQELSPNLFENFKYGKFDWATKCEAKFLSVLFNHVSYLIQA